MGFEAKWEEARELFLDLADLPEERRRGELDQLAAEDPELAAFVISLLDNDREETRDLAPEAPSRFGSYEVVRPIGRGGMGEVYVARRADGEYEREVAVKLLRRDAANRELVQRFHRERQALAQLDHEYIARLLDGGTTEGGEPYIVMEYVEGEPADAFAARLDLRERLELFVRIGQAVAHAHERGFVHRDLKPGNILVRPDGTPRLLDFGIARLDTSDPGADTGEALTRTGHRLFTPEYASPEQLRGEVATPRSDIFALGILLYVFLCGEKPWGDSATLQALEWNVCHEEPRPPSRLATATARSRIAGDLDAVAQQCLAKRPERRYASVAELCADIENHLAGRPIRARRTGVLGRAVRFSRRKPAYPVALILGTLTVLALWMAWASEQRGDRRREELRAAVSDRIATAKKLTDNGELEGARAELAAAELALQELPDEKRLEAETLTMAAEVANLDRDWETGLQLCERAFPLLEELQPPAHDMRTRLLNVRAYALQMRDAGESDRRSSRAASLAALEYAREHLQRGSTPFVDALLGQAAEQERAGDGEGALATLEEAVDQTRERDPRGIDLSRLLNEKGLALSNLGRSEEAAASYREAVELLAWHRGAGHADFGKVRFNLGATLFRLGHYEEARSELEDALAASREPGRELLLASSLHMLVRVHLQLGDLDAAEETAREALSVRVRHGDERMFGVRSRCLMGIVLARSGQAEEAAEILVPVLEQTEPGLLLPAVEAEARHMLGAILQDSGEDGRARPHLVWALREKRRLHGPEHEDCLDLELRVAELR